MKYYAIPYGNFSEDEMINYEGNFYYKTVKYPLRCVSLEEMRKTQRRSGFTTYGIPSIFCVNGEVFPLACDELEEYSIEIIKRKI